jgi:uncharacterized protein (TIGR02147 family)
MKATAITGDPFIAFLRNKFETLKTTNPRYSLRAFAGKLELDPSSLSKVFSGKKALSEETRIHCLKKIGASKKEIDVILKKGASEPLSHDVIPEDVFEVLGNWRYFAVLEFLRISNEDTSLFKLLKKKLDLDKDEAQNILSTLERIGFIEYKAGVYEVLKPNNSWSTAGGDTSLLRRKMQKDILERSMHALENVPMDQREHGSLLVAIDKKRLPEFKEALRRTRLELSDFFQSTTEYNEIYQFQMSFYPVTTLE